MSHDRTARKQQPAAPDRPDRPTAAAFIRLADLVLAMDTSVEIRGPERLGAGAPLLEGLQALREREYLQAGPHLLSPVQRHIEERCQLDERSWHFLAAVGGEPVGALRVTPSPFEMAELAPELRYTSDDYAGYLEFNRLLVARAHRHLSIGRRLIAAAARWGLASDSQGVVAVCRDGAYTLFAKYGLTVAHQQQIVVPSRPGGMYSLVHGTWRAIVETTVPAFAPFNQNSQTS
jgi:hypothetical protein